MWQESNNEEQQLSARMTDVVFRIECPRLPVDHAAALARAVSEHAPELEKSAPSGIHSIHVAGSQNGWERPRTSDEVLLLSKRTRFRIRVETEQAETLINQLSGVTLNVNEWPMQIVSGQTRPLKPATTLFSRYTYFEDAAVNNDEALFVARIIEQCSDFNFKPTKILCGREHTVETDNGTRLTRSVLFADVPALPSVLLQDNGLGNGRTMGCGLFIPHKDTGAVNDGAAESLH